MFDFISILIFFISYKLYNIYIATYSLIFSSLLKIFYFKIKFKKIEKHQMFLFLIIMFFCIVTLLFKNDMFIKWKVTIVYGVMGFLCLFSHVYNRKPFLAYFFKTKISCSNVLWKNLNLSFAIYFIFISILNLYVAYFYDTNTWINFKFFGISILTLVFIILQYILFFRNINIDK